MLLSNDDGLTWDDETVYPSSGVGIRCVELTCYAVRYAVRPELGPDWDGLMTTEAGTNHWRLLADFKPSELTRVLAPDKRIGAVKRFGAGAMVATAEGVYVAGFVDPGKEPWWGVVLRVSRDGAIAPVGHAVPEGLFVLERAPDGVLWAGGHGAFRLEAGEWVKAWSAPQ
jgi:hypothetical protein